MEYAVRKVAVAKIEQAQAFKRKDGDHWPGCCISSV